MNPSIKKLAKTASKRAKRIIGLMSGTSLDGLDIALCEIKGSGISTEVTLQKFETIDYSKPLKKRLKKITSVPRVSLEEVCLMHSWLGHYHGELVLDTLDRWDILPNTIDCIASHGQTLYHAPKIQHNRQAMPNATLQIGDGDHIARATGILTISDFRQKHTAAGKEGAPMASFVDRILYTDDTENRILLNIGGIANFSYLPANTATDQPFITTDTGPGNTLIDASMQKYFSKDFDKNGIVAREGSVNHQALNALKADPYFQKPLPKTTGPEVFNLEWVDNRLQEAGIPRLSAENLVATLTRLTAETIAETIRAMGSQDPSPVIYASGGGIHNPVVGQWLKELLPTYLFKDFETIGPNPDAKEALIFAVLANEMLSGEGFPLNPNSQNSETLNFGKISFPG